MENDTMVENNYDFVDNKAKSKNYYVANKEEIQKRVAQIFQKMKKIIE